MRNLFLAGSEYGIIQEDKSREVMYDIDTTQRVNLVTDE